ncbi:MAG: hypothetical protein ACOCU8_01305 [Patescibacteria group bacterium]
MNKKPEDLTPFRGEMEMKETDSFEFDVSRFKDDDRFVIKTLKKEPNSKLDEEVKDLPLIDYIKERYLKGYKLLKQYLGEAVPNSRFVIGQSETSAEPQLYLVQDRVVGLNIDELIKEEMTVAGIRQNSNANIHSSMHSLRASLVEAFKYNDLEGGLEYRGLDKCQRIFDMLRQLDDIMFNSFKMWEETLNSDEVLSLGLSADQEIRRKKQGEGLFPEVTNYQNLIYGKTHKDDKPKLYLIDNGLILVSKSFMTENTSGAFGFNQALWSVCLPLRELRLGLQGNQNDFFDRYNISDQEKEERLKMLESRSGDYYDQLIKKYSSDR